jgi:hypothetical protein
MPTTIKGNAGTFSEASEMEVTRAAEGEKPDGFVQPSNNRSVATQESPPYKKVDKQSLDYILRIGLAGGLAGCAVRALTNIRQVSCMIDSLYRQRPLLVHSTASRSFFKHRILNLSNIQHRGLAW